MPVAHIAAIEADNNAAFRNRQLLPLCRAAIDEAVSLLAEFRLGAFSHAQHVLTDGHGIGAGDNRQDLRHQFSGGSVRHERDPACFQVEALGRYLLMEKIAKRRDGARSLCTAAGAGMQALTAQLDVAEECVIGEWIAAFDAPPLPAIWSTGPVEGHINRLKMLKRQMFGRAHLDLLSRRFVLAPRGEQAQAPALCAPSRAYAETEVA
jgi:hypothetical protein